MTNRSKTRILGVITVASIGAATYACTKEQTAEIKTAVSLVDTACVLLSAANVNGTVDQVCAYEHELAPLVPVILSMRKMNATPDAGTETDVTSLKVSGKNECQTACSNVCAAK